MNIDPTLGMRHYISAFFISFIFTSIPSIACTIVSGIDANGQVWNANNEDGPNGVANFINVFPKSADAKYGYFTLSYISPSEGEGGNIQGGMNEAGLTFDFNAIKWIEDFDVSRKQNFPQGDHAILPHILANLSSVQEVIDFFEIYWFQNGFRSAQMHVADRLGRFAIISASGVKLVEEGDFLVSTNFDICGKEDSTPCWRYPIATNKLTNHKASLETMMSICRATAQKNGGTLYSNIQNLTTGDIWFFSKHDPGKTISLNILDLLSKGQNSYTFSDLESLIEKRPDYIWDKPEQIELSEDKRKDYEGKYGNYLLGEMFIQKEGNGLQLSLGNGENFMLMPKSSNEFYFPHEDLEVEFLMDREDNRMSMRFYEKGIWSFTAWK